MSAAWETLSAAALLGTSRRTPDVSALPPAVRAALPERAGTDSAAELLDAASLYVLYQRAGATPVPPPPHAGAGGPAPAPAGRPLSPAAAARLADLLRGVGTNTAAMLAIWLIAAARAGFDAPAEHLPELLDLAPARPDLAADIRAVLGTRGHWLAAQRSDWSAWLRSPDGDGSQPGPPDQTVWTHGTPAQRHSWFAALRRRDPGRARGLLLALEWTSIEGPSRLAFVTALETGLSADDERLLERARADRRKDVRLAALRLLTLIPGSAYLRDLTEVARGALTVDAGRLRVTLPSPLPALAGAAEFAVPAWLRDLAHRTDPGTPSASATALLWYLATVVPLSTWEEALRHSPAELVALPMDGDLALVVHNGWDDAAIRERNAGWAMALMGWRDPASMGALLLALPPPRRQKVVIAALTRDRAGTQSISAGTAESILRNCPPPWTPDLTSSLLSWLSRETQASNIWGAFPLLARLGHSLPPDPGTEASVRAIARLHPVNSSWFPALAELAATLLYRRQMLEELR